MIRILLAQAIHETGNFSSNIFEFNNNAFGMKHPTRRKTLDLGILEQRGVLLPDQIFTVPGFARFNSIEDSARDMILYLDHFSVPLRFTDPFDYVRALKARKYFEDSLGNYFRGVRDAFDSLPSKM